jgi:murein DD-endopeptidase MepM/ murein hydrolase activator NlpD
MKWHWPLQQKPLFPDDPGLFGARRKNDIHTGIDLYTERGTQVVAVEAGVVVLVENFTGPNASDPSPWWNDTQAVLVEGASGVVTYGEVAALVKEGQTVEAGEVVGVVAESILRRFKGRPMVMLHIELMTAGARNTLWWRLDEPQPATLRDITPKLTEAAGANLQHFDLAAYDGVSFR